MIPFHRLSRILAETALQSGRLSEIEIYYFHNCPVEYLYHDPNLQKAELIEDIFMKCLPQKTIALIFSDAGSARGGLNINRINLTEKFLINLKNYCRYFVWINPMPSQRWEYSTAENISSFVPMFTFSRRDFQNAINVLQGHSTYIR